MVMGKSVQFCLLAHCRPLLQSGHFYSWDHSFSCLPTNGRFRSIETVPIIFEDLWKTKDGLIDPRDVRGKALQFSSLDGALCDCPAWSALGAFQWLVRTVNRSTASRRTLYPSPGVCGTWMVPRGVTSTSGSMMS